MHASDMSHREGWPGAAFAAATLREGVTARTAVLSQMTWRPLLIPLVRVLGRNSPPVSVLTSMVRPTLAKPLRCWAGLDSWPSAQVGDRSTQPLYVRRPPLWPAAGSPQPP